LGNDELAEEVPVDAAERIARLGAVALEADVGDQVDQALHLLQRDAAAGVVAWQLALEVGVVALDGEDGVVDQRSDVGACGLVLRVLPARLGRHPEDMLSGVLVAVLRQAFELGAGDAVGGQLGLEFVTPGVEGVRVVLQEEQAEDDVFVFCRVDLSAQGIGRLPENFGAGEVGVIGVRCRHQGSVGSCSWCGVRLRRLDVAWAHIAKCRVACASAWMVMQRLCRASGAWWQA
jgi:hypothetical protein